MRARTALILPYSLFILLFFCGNTDEFFTVEIVDGVRYVHNIKPQWGDGSKVELEFVWKIGGLDETDENFLLFRPTDAAVDSKGDVYILDRGNFRIQKFDREGRYISTFGREGEGPGEFRFPVSLQISRDDHLYVHDILKIMTIELDKYGNEVNTVRSQKSNYRNYTHLSSGNFIVTNRKIMNVDSEKAGEVESIPLLAILDEHLNVISEFCFPKYFGGPLLNVSMNSLEFAADDLENIYVSFSRQNRIEKYATDGY